MDPMKGASDAWLEPMVTRRNDRCSASYPPFFRFSFFLEGRHAILSSFKANCVICNSRQLIKKIKTYHKLNKSLWAGFRPHLPFLHTHTHRLSLRPADQEPLKGGARM